MSLFGLSGEMKDGTFVEISFPSQCFYVNKFLVWYKTAQNQNTNFNFGIKAPKTKIDILILV